MIKGYFIEVYLLYIHWIIYAIFYRIEAFFRWNMFYTIFYIHARNFYFIWNRFQMYKLWYSICRFEKGNYTFHSFFLRVRRVCEALSSSAVQLLAWRTNLFDWRLEPQMNPGLHLYSSYQLAQVVCANCKV